MLSTFLVPSSLYFISNYWIYPLKDYIGDTGCYILIYSRDIENFIIQLHSFFMATFRYVCLFHDNLLQKFNLSPNVSKVHTFWESHKMLRNLHWRFDWHYSGDFAILWPSQNIWNLQWNLDSWKNLNLRKIVATTDF